MNPDRQPALNYLRAPAGGLWHWAEDGTVLVWRDGTTIAFREEVSRILEWLAPNGLPPFGALVFLLAACRGKIPGVADVVTSSEVALPSAAGAQAVLLVTARKQLHAQLAAALAQLARVAQLPSELNTGLQAKCVLAEVVFEPAKVERYVEAQAVLRGLGEALSDAELADPEPGPASGSYLRQIHILSEGLKRHTPESLALRLRTGLDALPQAGDVALPSAERARRLIEELSGDREFGAVGRAARELLAAVRLPRRLGEAEPLAGGGVADLTNRGPLDRLLLSELAHDDLTLAVRVALNEALYLRREPPTREPPGTLALLLDAGVRLWGVPRVLGAAVALAFIARGKAQHEVVAWRARGRQLQTVDLLSRAGLVEHLGALEPTAHPGEAVPAFAAAVGADPLAQSVLITHPDTLADPEFRRRLAEHPAAPDFVATVDREGRFALHALPLAHRPALCEAELELASVFEAPAAVTLINPQRDPNLPAIFGLAPFPFLLPLAGRVEASTRTEDGRVCALLKDRRLVLFGDLAFGARVLASELPGGRTVWLAADAEAVHLVKAGSSQRPARLFSVGLPQGPLLRATELANGPELLGVHRYGSVLVVIRSHDVRAYALDDGRLLDRVRNPHQWAGGRYFRGTNQFYFVRWDGQGVKFDPVILPTVYLASSVAAVFDRAGLPGPWLLCRSGQLVSIETGQVLKLPVSAHARLNFDAPRVAPDGHQLLLPSGQAGPNGEARDCLIKLDRQISVDFVRAGSSFPEPTLQLPSWNLFRVFREIGCAEGGLALCDRKGRWQRLGLSPEGVLRLTPLTHGATVAHRLGFAEPRKAPQGCALQLVQWPNGSQAFLDSRGLLHLKSADPAAPEVSLVLASREVAGWTSDGCVCGPSFFFEEPGTSDPRGVFKRIQQCFPDL